MRERHQVGIDRRNNFDLLRLLAAFQVVYLHSVEHLGIAFGSMGRVFNDFLGLFPGVPIFFVISGFLISRSYERSAGGFDYARNRFLRLYPGLWTAFIVTLGLLLVCGALSWSFVSSPTFIAWVGSQVTVAQFFNPAALRGFGVGVVNGSLWTIPVEVQFYAAVPLLYMFILRRSSLRTGSIVLGGMALLSYAVWFATVNRDGAPGLVAKLSYVTLAPHLHMFLLGVLLQRHWNRIAVVFEGYAAVWLAGYVGAAAGARLLVGTTLTGRPPLGLVSSAVTAVALVLLACAIVSFAYTRRDVSERLLRGNDVSYGVYVYHMLVVNMLVYAGWVGSGRSLATAIALTSVCALLSWRFVERPALRLKHVPLLSEGRLGRLLRPTSPAKGRHSLGSFTGDGQEVTAK